MKRVIVLFPGDEDRNLTLPPTDPMRRLVAQVSKPAVSPTFRLRGAPKRRSGATAAKSARRWKAPGLRVLKPAIQQTWKSALQDQAAPPAIAPQCAATTRNRASQRRRNIRGRVRIFAQRT
jgi:hypothetical protein